MLEPGETQSKGEVTLGQRTVYNGGRDEVLFLGWAYRYCKDLLVTTNKVLSYPCTLPETELYKGKV